MTALTKGLSLALFFLNLLCFTAYGLDDREKLGSQPMQVQQPPQNYQNQQPQRPILPPVIPSSQPGISPTPSFPANYQPATIQTNFQSFPAKAMLPASSAPTELAQIPIIGNSVGKVTNKGSEKGGLPWIEVKDDLFNETLKININPKSTPVIKKTTVLSYGDINIGDTVNVVFNQQDENMIANFVSILTEEDLKAMEESLKEPKGNPATSKE